MILDRAQAHIQYFSTRKADPREWNQVQEKAQEILNFIREKKGDLDAMNISGTSSKKIENFLMPTIKRIGFEAPTGQEFEGKRLNPDFISRAWRIIIEVERGKTIQNNNDLLDFWKTHIHTECRYLILIVPVVLKQRKDSYPFEQTVRRLAAFFESGNETNVHGLVVIGY